jgi:hypothetical protein
MSRHLVAALLLTGALCVTSSRDANAAMVNLSLNVFPTNVALPNNGGTWRIVAKTDAPLGIAAISAYLGDLNLAGLTVEPDIGHDFPFAGGMIGGAVNAVYGQNNATGPLVFGVGTPSMSDGPDPLGNPLWDGATRIFAGTYSGVVPSFTIAGQNQTDANVLIFTQVGQPAQDADTTTVVRVQVPEPAAAVTAVIAMAGLVAVRRRR